MYNVTRVLSKMFSRVGWKQPTQAEYAILTEPNTLTLSGRYFQDTYSAVTIQNIKDLQQDPDISDADFNLALEDLQKSAILDTLSAVFNSIETVDTVQTFDREDNIADSVIVNTGEFVGYKIDIASSQDFATALSSVALYFNADATFELKCFVDNKAQAIWTKEVAAIGNELTVIDVSDLVLSYMSDKTRSRTFYIGYFQEDIGAAQAIDEVVLTWNFGCLWRSQTFESTPLDTKFEIPIYPTSKTYGLNLQFTSSRDMTNRIVANVPLFDQAVSLQMACKVLEMILSSSRSNATERITQELLGDIFRELNQEIATTDKPYAPGLKARYAGEIIKLHKSFYGQPRIETHSLPYAVYADRDNGGGFSY
jgi:hypothetical protein